MRMPAICDSCLMIFASGFEVVDCANTTFSGCTSGPCPKCGDVGRVPDGTYDVFGDTLKLLSGPSQTIEDLRRLSDILANARAQKASRDEVIATVEENVPKLRSIGDFLPQTRPELYTVIGLVIAAIALLSGNGSKKSDTEITFNQVINQIYGENQPAKSGRPAAAQEKIGRNQPCPCNSGKKYKHCHGKIP